MKRRTRYRYQSARKRRIRRILAGVSALCLLVATGLLIRYAGHAAQADSNFSALKKEYDAGAQGMITPPPAPGEAVPELQPAAAPLPPRCLPLPEKHCPPIQP